MNKSQKPRDKVFYGWIVLLAAFFTYLSTMGPRSAFGNLVQPWASEFGWNMQQMSLAASIGLILYGFFQPIAGWLVNRFGPRKVTLWGLLVYGTTSIFVSLISSLWQLYALYGVVMGIAWSACTTISLSALISSWFYKKRGLALSIAQSGMALGQFLLVPISMFLIINRGWRLTIGFLGALVLIIALPVIWWLVRDTPQEMGLLPDGRKEQVGPVKSATGDPKVTKTHQPPGMGLGAAMRTPSFWLLVGSFFICGMTAHMLAVHFVPAAISAGYPPLEAATAGGLAGGASFLGIFASGFISDIIGRKIPLAALYLMRGLGLIMLMFSFSKSTLFLSASLIGFGTLGTASITAGLVADIYGVASMGTILGMVSMGHQIAGGISVYLAGMIAHESGNYYWVFLPSAFFLFAAFLACLFIQEKRPQNEDAAAASLTQTGKT